MRFWLGVTAVMVVVLLSARADAIGIGPGNLPVDFEPNLDSNFSFYIRNSANVSADFNVYASGDLSSYITLEKSTVTLGPKEIRTLSFNLKLPATLEPGRHDNAIGVVEATVPDAPMAAQLSVQMLLWVSVPYPDNYIAVSVANSKPELNEKTEFTVALSNPSKNDLTATANLEIRDKNDTLLERFLLGSAYIAVGDSKTFQAGWTPRLAGDYKAVARAYYVGETTVKEKTFTVKVPMAAPVPALVWEEAPPNLIPYVALIILLVIAIVMVIIWPKDVRKNG